MKVQKPIDPVNDAQGTYALARARVELSLEELRQALERHEADRANWERAEVLEEVERGLGELLARVRAP